MIYNRYNMQIQHVDTTCKYNMQIQHVDTDTHIYKHSFFIFYLFISHPHQRFHNHHPHHQLVEI